VELFELGLRKVAKRSRNKTIRAEKVKKQEEAQE
jgi:hypothetical protein